MELSNHELEQVTRLQEALLNIRLDRTRIRELLAEIAELVGAKAAMGAWLDGGMPILVTHRAGPEIERYFASVFAGVDAEGNIRAKDPLLDEINLTRRRMGSGVYHENALADRETITRATFFQEAFAPAGMHHVIGMTTRLAVGEALFTFGFEGDDDPGFVSGRTENLLRLLLPTFGFGFGAIDRAHRHQERLDKAIAEARVAATVKKLGVDGHQPHRDMAGKSLIRLPLPELLGEEGGQLQVSLNALRIEDLAAALAIRFALSPRQRETAELMLRGFTSREIADELGIRINTARRHCEAVLQRVGVGRRDQLAICSLSELVDG
ncbi:MAG: LuxR C-terminal-related transcriptional regulator [Halomonas sp.]|uniref:helix-turn-helix transcriptional regulator n=1 Tax=Halomonas sp. TaxID=1486246 RepID=UPI002ACD82E8|nr:LuxR C-terminal-related transcriptional regulator [Halomonas sp.]MDZ7852845.1 LuxR C-terminal-related transcriptional regulator [Halomonas sp.]